MRNYSLKKFKDFDVNEIRGNFLTREYSLKDINISRLYKTGKTEWILPWDLLRINELIKFIELYEKLNYDLDIEDQANLVYSELDLEKDELTENVRYLKEISPKLDIFSYEILERLAFNLNYRDLTSLCSSNIQFSQICNNNISFWRTYILHNYDYRLPTNEEDKEILTIEYLREFVKNEGSIPIKYNWTNEYFYYYEYYIKLDLNNFDRRDFKPNIFNSGVLSNLRELRLDKFHNFIFNISSLTELTYLDLNGNYYIEDISSLTNLSYLDLGENNKIDNINMLINLKKLYLGINRKISDVFSLTNLTYLDLGSNKIDNINMLTNLKELYLNENYKISYLSDLIKLEILHLGTRNTRLKNINMLTDLKKLYLGRNIFIRDILSLTRLEYLDLGTNKIIKDISTLNKLKYLYLNKNNRISDISNLTRLKILWLGDNDKIINLDSLINLEELFLNYNQALLQELFTFKEITRLVNLKRLYLTMENNNTIDLSNLLNLGDKVNMLNLRDEIDLQSKRNLLYIENNEVKLR